MQNEGVTFSFKYWIFDNELPQMTSLGTRVPKNPKCFTMVPDYSRIDVGPTNKMSTKGSTNLVTICLRLTPELPTTALGPPTIMKINAKLVNKCPLVSAKLTRVPRPLVTPKFTRVPQERGWCSGGGRNVVGWGDSFH